jgi:hypothetical protein
MWALVAGGTGVASPVVVLRVSIASRPIKHRKQCVVESVLRELHRKTCATAARDAQRLSIMLLSVRPHRVSVWFNGGGCGDVLLVGWCVVV